MRHASDHPGAVLEGLLGALDDDDAKVRGSAALALADAGADEAVEALIARVDDPDLWVQQMAITALGELRDERAAPRLQRALRDPRPEVRFQAAMSFPRVATKDDALAALLDASRDDDAEVCRISLRMAEELGDPGDEGGAVHGRVLERAKAMLRHDADKVALAAAVVVAREGLDAGDRILVKAIADELSGADAEDVAAAIELAGDRRLEQARAGLERRAFGGLLGLRRDPFAWHARVALAQMGHERAVREILRDLTGWSWHRRTLAAAAAGRARLGAAKPILEEMERRGGRADPNVLQSAIAAYDDTPVSRRAKAD